MAISATRAVGMKINIRTSEEQTESDRGERKYRLLLDEFKAMDRMDEITYSKFLSFILFELISSFTNCKSFIFDIKIIVSRGRCWHSNVPLLCYSEVLSQHLEIVCLWLVVPLLLPHKLSI